MDRSDSNMGLTVFLTAAAIAFVIVFYVVFGTMGLLFGGITVPVCLFLLWMSRDVRSWEERWAPKSREAAPASTPSPGAASAKPAESRA